MKTENYYLTTVSLFSIDIVCTMCMSVEPSRTLPLLHKCCHFSVAMIYFRGHTRLETRIGWSRVGIRIVVHGL